MENLCCFESSVNKSGTWAGGHIVKTSAVQSLIPWGEKGDGESSSCCSQAEKSLLLLFILKAVLSLCCVDGFGDCLVFFSLSEQGRFGARVLGAVH